MFPGLSRETPPVARLLPRSAVSWKVFRVHDRTAPWAALPGSRRPALLALGVRGQSDFWRGHVL